MSIFAGTLVILQDNRITLEGSDSKRWVPIISRLDHRTGWWGSSALEATQAISSQSSFISPPYWLRISDHIRALSHDRKCLPSCWSQRTKTGTGRVGEVAFILASEVIQTITTIRNSLITVDIKVAGAEKDWLAF
jgi:hypothetical protein